VSAHDARESAATRAVGLVRGILGERVIISNELDPFFSLRALAAYSSLSVRKLRDLLDDPAHPLPAYMVGNKLLIRKSEFDSWMATHRRQRGADVDKIVNEVLRGLST